ncbi:hypothetical protein AAE478_002360 [Parahypoxylon ruwenzoriense]
MGNDGSSSRFENQASLLGQIQSLGSSSAKDGSPPAVHTSRAEIPTTTAADGINNKSSDGISLGSSTFSRQGQSNIDIPALQRHRVHTATTGAGGIAKPEKLKVIEYACPTIDTISHDVSQSGYAGAGAGGRQLGSGLLNHPEGVPYTQYDDSRCQTSQPQGGSLSQAELSEFQTGPSHHTLRVPRINDRGQPRCPKCKWTLLTRPLSHPSVPIISVTDPQGTVRYPYDHTYYPDEFEEEDDSDTWD